MGVLTTGFNAPAVDLIAMLRPTKSTGLYVQMAGRGTRLVPAKDNCLVLDFAGNVARHGPIDLVKPRNKLNGEGNGEAPTKVCRECRTINALTARMCIECDYLFPLPVVQLEATATTRPILSVGAPQWLDVRAVTYHRHDKPGKRASLRVDYHCGLARHREWICLQHDGYAGTKAAAWWRHRAGDSDIPATVDDALARADELRQPVQIAVRPNGRFMEVVHARFV
jgi:DNA repair protein RadD